jgi:hypothetical protein
MAWAARALGSFALALLLAIETVSASDLPDEGIRRRLNGCWNVLGVTVARLCFDGVDRVEFFVPDDTSMRRGGTFTVSGGRVLFDLSPDDNPANEIYASCAVEIAADREPTTFSLAHCVNWSLLNLPLRPTHRGLLKANRAASTWLAVEAYAGRGHSTVNAPLAGCWKQLLDRDRRKYVAEGVREFGAFLSEFQICFEGESQGRVTTVTLDAFDGWEGEG